MKKYLRNLALILVLSVCLSAFVSCASDLSSDPPEESTGEKNENTDGNSETAGSQTDATAEGSETAPDIPEKNYDDKFYLNIYPGSNPVKYYWTEEYGHDILSKVLYERQEKIKNDIGVEIIGIETVGDFNYAKDFINAVKNKEGTVDALISHMHYGIDSFVKNPYLTDFKNIPEIKLDVDYWNRSIMEEVGIKDHLYLGYSDLNIPYTYVVAFNKDILSKYENSLDEDLYTSAENYRWTLDKMISVSQLAYIDTLSDGKTSDDTFGFVTSSGDIGYSAMLRGLGVKYMVQNDKSEYVMGIFTEENKPKMYDIIGKFYNFVKSDYANITPMPEFGLSDNRALMTLADTYSDLPNLRATDIDVGVLPYPMYNEDQREYFHLSFGGFICVPSYMGEGDHPAMIGETLNLLSSYGREVNEMICDKQLSNSYEDVKMLDIVWNSICSDVALAYFTVTQGGNYSYPYCLKTLSLDNTGRSPESILATYVAVEKTHVERGIRKLIEAVK